MAEGVTLDDNEELYYPKEIDKDLDFIGFSFNGVTSEDLGLSRVSDGSRYTEEMLPNFQDVSAKMPGSDYTLYWESFYNTKNLPVQIAFDSMTDAQMRLFKQTFDTKNLSKLTFAERTYQCYEVTTDATPQAGKTYYSIVNLQYTPFTGQNFVSGTTYYEIKIKPIYWLAKVQSPPQLKYVCFEEKKDDKLQRIYKGEGTINFIAYYPFGMADYGYDEYLGIKFPDTSNQTSTNGGEYIFNLLDSGDRPFEWMFTTYSGRARQLSSIKLYDITDGSEVLIGQLNFNPLPDDSTYYYYQARPETHYYLMIDSKTNLVEMTRWVNRQVGYEHLGVLYNKYIVSGDFFKIPNNRITKMKTFYRQAHTGYDYIYYKCLYL